MWPALDRCRNLCPRTASGCSVLEGCSPIQNRTFGRCLCKAEANRNRWSGPWNSIRIRPFSGWAVARLCERTRRRHAGRLSSSIPGRRPADSCLGRWRRRTIGTLAAGGSTTGEVSKMMAVPFDPARGTVGTAEPLFPAPTCPPRSGAGWFR